MARPKTSSPVRSAGLRHTWETRWSKRSTGASERSLAMKLLLTLYCITSIAVPPVKHSSRAECIPFAERIEYKAPARVCAVCVLRAQCTRSHHGRTVQRHEKQALLDVARVQANSRAAWRNRRRRQHLIERSFADAANNHHFKRARWRRLWRQQIQDYLIAAIQNVRILLAHQNPKPSAAAAVAPPASITRLQPGFAY